MEHPYLPTHAYTADSKIFMKLRFLSITSPTIGETFTLFLFIEIEVYNSEEYNLQIHLLLFSRILSLLLSVAEYNK